MSRFARYLLIASLVACCVVILSACSQVASGPLALTGKDNGSQQTLSAGQEMQISLESNPTTGYRWSVDGAVPSQLQQVGAPKYTSTSSAVGSGGTEVWTFKGSTAGQGTLKLKYWRSFEPTTPPVSTFQVDVTVK